MSLAAPVLAPAFAKVCVLGLGYVGLPTAATMAARGIEVVGVDVNPDVVAKINRGEVHIVEPDLDAAVRDTVAGGTLRASEAVEPADAFIIAVPTPFEGTEKQPDLRFVQAAAEAVARVLRPGNLVILESTAPVGATDKMAGWMARARNDLTFPQTHGDAADIRVAHCPERVLPGKVLTEIVQNDRVIGGLSTACAAQAVALYQSFVTGECVTTNARTAEMAKLVENSFRDVNIAFAISAVRALVVTQSPVTKLW